MSYDPKIYIRDYGTPDLSLIVHSMPIRVEFHPADIIRNLQVEWENPLAGGEAILLSGDAQISGTDRVLFSGRDGVELISSRSLISVLFHDVEVLTGRFFDIDGAFIEVEFYPVDVFRNLVVTADHLPIDVDLHPVDVLRSLVVESDPFDIAITFHDVEIIVSSFILLSGDAQISGLDRLLLSGDAQVSGHDRILISE